MFNRSSQVNDQEKDGIDNIHYQNWSFVIVDELRCNQGNVFKESM